ncbi:MAG: response regulator [Candidatus Omnitrophota bacterium]
MGKKILLADDEVGIRTSLTDILEGRGYEVIHAANGQEAIEKARRENPDLVLLDTMMPGIGGIEACRQIKQVEKLPCKVIVYTGNIDAIDAVEARRCGADDYCVKGTDPSLLIGTVEKIL